MIEIRRFVTVVWRDFCLERHEFSLSAVCQRVDDLDDDGERVFELSGLSLTARARRDGFVLENLCHEPLFETTWRRFDELASQPCEAISGVGRVGIVHLTADWRADLILGRRFVGLPTPRGAWEGRP